VLSNKFVCPEVIIHILKSEWDLLAEGWQLSKKLLGQGWGEVCWHSWRDGRGSRDWVGTQWECIFPVLCFSAFILGAARGAEWLDQVRGGEHSHLICPGVDLILSWVLNASAFFLCPTLSTRGSLRSSHHQRGPKPGRLGPPDEAEEEHWGSVFLLALKHVLRKTCMSQRAEPALLKAEWFHSVFLEGNIPYFKINEVFCTLLRE
jgi:hypothetical protein